MVLLTHFPLLLLYMFDQNLCANGWDGFLNLLREAKLESCQQLSGVAFGCKTRRLQVGFSRSCQQERPWTSGSRPELWYLIGIKLLLVARGVVLQLDEFVRSSHGCSKKFKRMAADGNHLHLKIHSGHVRWSP